MKLAFTIGAYRLSSFIQLSIIQIRRLVPNADILISDDPSAESDAIKKIAADYSCNYLGARQRRGHFAADFQSLVNSLVFAEAVGADIAVKVSQRFIFRKPEAINVIQKVFENPNIMAATPGQPAHITGHKSFGAFGTLSDIVCVRRGSISPEDMLNLYRARLLREQVPWASFIECVVDELHSRVFPGRTAKIPELTNPTHDPIYLRRYQATERQYRDLALESQFNGLFPLGEWAHIEVGNYIARPMVI